MHSAPPAVSRAFRRREVLVRAAGVIGLALIAETASACGSQPSPPPVDPLQAQADLADADSALASAAATAAPPAQVPALTQVASERLQHSQALLAEIARAAGRTVAASNSTGPSATSATTGTAPAASPSRTPPPSLNDVVAALRTSADSATALATTLTGYRAGLLGSIAASCTTSYIVGLDIPKSAP